MDKFTHLDEQNKAKLVDVAQKEISSRIARAQSLVRLTPEILYAFNDGDINSKKGPVFQTARLAGIMAAKKTSDLIPLCHPLSINKCDVDIRLNEMELVEINCTVSCLGKTGVEMEALTGASIAALTIYDMCKAFSHDIEIVETKLIEKKGGKRDFKRD